ncbi:MAG: IS1634 family transposase, partial [Gemmatimonadales bacterium]
QIKKIRERFAIARVVLVGDRGMLTDARLREDLRPIEGLDWITALRAPAIQALAAGGALQLSLFDQQDLAEITHPDYPGERLIVCKNPFLAEERTRKRGELLETTERELAKIAAATTRAKRPLRGQAHIALRVGKVLGRRKVGKHFTLEITDTRFRAARDEAAIAREAALDGIYVLRTSVAADRLPMAEAVRSYKRLAAIERAFRSLKTVDLKVRPIHHRKADRVRAHVFLCMLAYYVEWHMRRALAPLLFDDDDQAAAEAERRSVVAPAQRSPRAKAKALTKRTDEGEPVHSFQSLLRHLRTNREGSHAREVRRGDRVRQDHYAHPAAAARPRSPRSLPLPVAKTPGRREMPSSRKSAPYPLGGG